MVDIGSFEVWATIVAIAGCVLGYQSWRASRLLRRAEFIRTYPWPPGLLDKLQEKHAGFTRKETALISHGLRQFFIAHLASGNRFVSMPSQAVDDLWHEFILYTREYKEFCRRAFGGFLHHTPAVAMRPSQRSSNEGMLRVWRHACKEENIDPRSPTRLPLLFALDAKVNIPNGFLYQLDCDPGHRGGNAGVYCAADLALAMTANVLRRDRSGTGGCGGGCSGGCGGGCGG